MKYKGKRTSQNVVFIVFSFLRAILCTLRLFGFRVFHGLSGSTYFFDFTYQQA